MFRHFWVTILCSCVVESSLRPARFHFDEHLISKRGRLISCYFGSGIKFIKFVILTGEEKPHLNASHAELFHFADRLLKQMNQRLPITILRENYHLNYEEPVSDASQLYSWSGDRFPERNDEEPEICSAHNSDAATDENKNCQNHHHQRRIRRVWDEGEFGVIVLIDSLQILDQYLYGFARQPFHTPKNKYLIINLRNASETTHREPTQSLFDLKSNASASSHHRTRALKGYWLLAKMWNFYGILNVALVYYDMKILMTYNPFAGSNTEYNADGFKMHRLGETKCSDLLPPRRVKLNGHKLKVCYFYRNPTAIPWSDLPNYFLKSKYAEASKYSLFGGFDGIVFGNLVKALNITPIMSEVDRLNRYGQRFNDGMFEGSIAEILYGRAAIIANSRFIMDIKTDRIEFLYPVSTDKLCIIAPKAQRIPQYLSYFKCFTPLTWGLIGILFVFYVIIWQLYKMVASRSELSNRAVQHNNWSETFNDVLLIMTNGPVWGLNTIGYLEKLLIFGLMIFSLIMNSIFESSLTSSFGAISYAKDLTSLKDVKKSGLAIVLASTSLRSVFKGNDRTDIMKSLQSQVVIDENFDKRLTAVYRNSCFLDKNSDFEVIKLDYIRSDGTKLLHRVQECPSTYHSSLFVRKGWPLSDTFNWILAAFNEGGFYRFWYKINKKVMIRKKEHRLVKSQKNHQRFAARSTDRPFTLDDVRLILEAYIIGCLISICVFFCEVFWVKIRILRRNIKFLLRKRPWLP